MKGGSFLKVPTLWGKGKTITPIKSRREEQKDRPGEKEGKAQARVTEKGRKIREECEGKARRWTNVCRLLKGG